MSALVMIGWLAIFGFGFYATIVGLVAGQVDLGFSGKIGWFPIAMVALGCAVIAAAIHIAPFDVVARPSAAIRQPVSDAPAEGVGR